MTELLSFEIENYRSFYKPQTVVFGEGSTRTITALYGPNAGGKSNVIKALATMISCIVNSANASWQLPYDPFLLRKGAHLEPTRFKVEFKSNKKIYTYEFSYRRNRIISETLLERPVYSKRSKTVFARNESNGLNSTAVKNGFGKKLHGKTRLETLLVTKGREDNNAYSNTVFDLLSSVSIVGDSSDMSDASPRYVEILKQDEGLREKTVSLLKKCDISIRGIKLETVPLPNDFFELIPFALPAEISQDMIRQGGTAFKTLHAIRDEAKTVVGTLEFDFWKQESMGTKKFFEVAVPIIDAIENGKTILIDEFSSYIHPALADAILAMFRNQPEGESEAKLILITHNTAMMQSCLQRDEIVFVEKNLVEESRITTAAAAGARKGDSLEKRYRAGFYGAVPLIRE